MIDQVDQRLKDWVTGVLGGIEVLLSLPDPSRAGKGVCLYLFELVPKPAPRSNTPPPLQISLRYLVTTWSEDTAEAHRMLGDLVFAAMPNTDFEADLNPLPPATWTAFGLAPQPSFVLTVPLRVERPVPPVKLVRKPLVVHTAPITSLSGVVLGPGNVPLPKARVEIPILNLFDWTDTRGRFHFPALPGEPRTLVLRIQAKGRELQTKIDQPASDQEPVVIHFDLFD